MRRGIKRTGPIRGAALAFCAFAVASPNVLSAEVGSWRTALVEKKAEPAGPAGRKIGARLRDLLARMAARGITRANARARNASALSNASLRVGAAGRVQVYVALDRIGSAELTGLGGEELDIEVSNESLAVVQGWVPFDRIERLAALPFVRRVTAPRYARTRAGSVQSEGDAILMADELRALGLDGTGVRVGVISDGANDWLLSQASGDLPAGGITVFGTCAPRPFDGPNCDGGWICDEGTAMGEIIHDLAPGAELAIVAAGTSLEFIDGIDDLANVFGAQVIVDDLGFFAEPYYEHGDVAQAVEAVKDDLVFLSAAGNDALGHHEADYLDSGNAFFSHDFGAALGGSTDDTMDVRVDPGEILVAFLQWNDRFGQSGNDFDLFITDSVGNLLCGTCASAALQNGSQDPIEAACYYNGGGATVTAHLSVDRFAGAGRQLELFVLGGSVQQHNVPEGTIVGHPAVEGVVATGAIDAADPGADTIESYSSRGLSEIFFPAFESRQKPDLAAIDGVSVTAVGGFFTPFFGTSAAAPHAGAVAALLIESAPSASPAEIRAAMMSGAVDLGAAGADTTFGAGRLDALAAVGFLDSDDDGTANDADPDDDGDGMTDDFEIANGLRPFDALDAGEDPDADGATNLEEFTGGTDPNDPASKPRTAVDLPGVRALLLED